MRDQHIFLALSLVAACGDSDGAAGESSSGASDTDLSGPTSPSTSGPDATSESTSASTTTDPGTESGSDESSTTGPVDIPPEIDDLRLYEWGAISQNTLADVDPCPSRDCAWSATEGQAGVLNDWTGGAFASEEGPLGGLVYWGGGHGGYYGNEVYLFDLSTLRWERRIEPSDGQTPGDANTYGLDLSTGLFWDGRPVATHTYDGVDYHPGTNSFMLLTSGDSIAPPWVPNDFAQPYAHRFGFDNNEWVAGTGACPGYDGFVSSAYDPNRDWFWIWSYPNSILSSYDPASDTWISYAQDLLPNLDHVSEIHPELDLFVTLEFRASNEILIKDLADPDADAVAVTRQGDLGIESFDAAGFKWVDPLGGFIAWSGGQSIYLLEAPDNWRNDPWTWTEIVGSGENPGPTPDNGTYTKFQYAPKVGAAVVANSRDGAVYAIKLVK